MIKNEALPAERKELMVNALMILKIIEGINTLDGYAAENRGHLLLENSDIAADNWRDKAVDEFKKALLFHPQQFRARTALAKLLEEEGRRDEAVRLMNDGVNYFYRRGISGLDEFYEYAIKLNLMSGDTTKARELQRKIVSLKEWRSTQSILLEN
jgi:tetratricopeptide (TPR) repeat protein